MPGGIYAESSVPGIYLYHSGAGNQLLSYVCYLRLGGTHVERLAAAAHWGWFSAPCVVCVEVRCQAL